MKRALIALLALAACTSPADANRLRARAKVTAFVEPPSTPPPLLPGAYQGNIGSWPSSPLPADITNASSCVTPATYCRQVIADWDVVPYETITASRKIGVVAYIAPTATQYGLGKTNPIDYVEIACDGGAPARIEEAALNSDTGEIEYFVAMDPANFTDGLHECRFTAVPEEGRSRIGQGATVDHYQPTYSLFINTDTGAQSLPYQQRIVSPTGVDDAGCGDTLGNACRQVWGARDALKASMGSDIGGGVICLMEGSYQWGKPSTNPTITNYPSATQFVTVQPCASQDKADVIFTTAEGTTSGGGTFQPRGWGLPKLRVKGLTTQVNFTGDSDYSSRSVATVPGQEIIWFDDVACTAASCLSGSRLKAGYATGVSSTGGARPFTWLRLARNTHVIDATDDTYTGTKMVLTALIDYVQETDAAAHPDIWQNANAYIFNAIVRDLTCTAFCDTAALFSDGVAGVRTEGLAWVNVDVNTISPNTQLAVAGWWKQVFILDSQFIRAGGMSLDAFTTATNFKDWNFTNTICGDTDLNAVAAVAAEITIFGGTGCAP